MLKVHRKDQIAPVGASMDYGLCIGKSKSGEPCDAVINKCVSAWVLLSRAATVLCCYSYRHMYGYPTGSPSSSCYLCCTVVC